MQSRPGRVFELLELARTGLDPLDAAAGDAKDDLVASRVLMLRMLLARAEDGLEDADVLGAVRLAGDELATFKGRDAVLHINELVLDDGFAERNHILDHGVDLQGWNAGGESGNAGRGWPFRSRFGPICRRPG
jgi:hypothetical protein